MSLPENNNPSKIPIGTLVILLVIIIVAVFSIEWLVGKLF